VKALALGSIAVAVAAGAFAGGYGAHGSTHTYSHTTTVVVRTVTSPPKVVTKYRTRTVQADASGYVNCIMQLAWFLNVYPAQNQYMAPQSFGAWDQGPTQCAGLGLPAPPLP